MPASAGRVRMPHNNRMSTSSALKTSSIWQKTIGHDPHAEPDQAAEPTLAEREAASQKAASVMLMARQQNLTGDSTNRDQNFTRQLYAGLKGGKKRRHPVDDAALLMDGRQGIPHDEVNDDSSSEEEFKVAAIETKQESKNKKKSSRKKRKRHRNDSSDESDDSSSESSEDSREERRRRKRREKKRKEKRRRSRYSSSDDSRNDGDDEDSAARDQRRRDRSRKKHKSSKKSKSDRSKDVALEPFISAPTFAGSKKGYVFQNGKDGVGYYVDSGKKLYATTKLRSK